MKHLAVLFIFLALPVCVVSAASKDWKTRVMDTYVITQVYGEITHGDWQGFIFHKNNCSKVQHVFTVYTMAKGKFRKLKGAVLPIKMNERETGARAIHGRKCLSGYRFMVDLGTYKKAVILDFLRKSKGTSIEMIDGNNYIAEEFFDITENRWLNEGAEKELANGQAICKETKKPRSTPSNSQFSRTYIPQTLLISCEMPESLSLLRPYLRINHFCLHGNGIPVLSIRQLITLSPD